MNLILIISLMLLWTASEKREQVLINLGSDIYGLAMNIAPERVIPIQSYSDLVKSVGIDSEEYQRLKDQTNPAVLDLVKSKLRSIRISDVLAIKEVFPVLEDLIIGPAPDPQISKLYALPDPPPPILRESAKRKMDSEYLKATMENLHRNIEKIKLIVNDYQLNLNMSFGAAEKRISPKIEIPFIGQKVEIKDAILLLACGIMSLYFYLLSVLKTMFYIADKVETTKGIDWIFFHQGKLSQIIGIVWLCFPALGVGLAGLKGSMRWQFSIILFLSLLSIGIWVFTYAQKVRHRFHDRLATIGSPLT